MLIPPRSIATEGIGMVDSPNVSPSNEAKGGPGEWTSKGFLLRKSVEAQLRIVPFFGGVSCAMLERKLSIPKIYLHEK